MTIASANLFAAGCSAAKGCDGCNIGLPLIPPSPLDIDGGI